MSEPNTNGKKSANRGAGGRFGKGNRASPGRPPGRGAVAELRDKLAQDLDKVIGVLRAQALTGDPQAIRILLDRVLPSLRPVEIPAVVTLPVGNSLTEQGRAVLAAVAVGDLAPGQGAALLASLGTLAKLTEADELTRRLEALEARNINEGGKA